MDLLLKSGSIEFEPVCRYYRTLAILVAEAECYFHRSPSSDSKLNQVEELLDQASEELSEYEYSELLCDIATAISVRMYK